MNCINRCEIGAGTHWVVEKCTLEKAIKFGDKYYDVVAIKSPKNYSPEFFNGIDENILIYNKIKNANLRTLYFFEKEENQDCIITEYINGGDIIYLSPNTAQTFVDMTNQKSLESIYKQNKIKKLNSNIEIFKLIEEEVIKASKAKLGFVEDAFFWGYDKKNNIIADYKIADFDTIAYWDEIDENIDHVLEKNTFVMINSLWEFYDNFVDISNIDNLKFKKIIEKKLEYFRNFI